MIFLETRAIPEANDFKGLSPCNSDRRAIYPHALCECMLQSIFLIVFTQCLVAEFPGLPTALAAPSAAAAAQHAGLVAAAAVP